MALVTGWSRRPPGCRRGPVAPGSARGVGGGAAALGCPRLPGGLDGGAVDDGDVVVDRGPFEQVAVLVAGERGQPARGVEGRDVEGVGLAAQLAVRLLDVVRDDAAPGEGPHGDPAAVDGGRVQVPVDAHLSPVGPGRRARLVGHDHVGHRLVGHRPVERVDGRLLLPVGVHRVVAEVARVVEAGHSQPVQQIGRVCRLARLEQHDVGDPAHPVAQRPVSGRRLVVVAGGEDVGHPEGLDSREDTSRVGLGDRAEVDQVTGVDHRVDLLGVDDRAHQAVLVLTVHVGDQQHAGRDLLVEVGRHEVLLQRLRQGQQVEHVGGDLRRAGRDVLQQGPVALHLQQQPGRAEALEGRLAVGHDDPAAGGQAGDEQGAEHDAEVAQVGAATPPRVVQGERESQGHHARARDEPPSHALRGRGQGGRDLVRARLQGGDVDVAAGEDRRDRVLDRSGDLDAGGDDGRAEAQVDVTHDRGAVEHRGAGGHGRQADRGRVVGGLDGGRGEVRRRHTPEVAGSDDRDPPHHGAHPAAHRAGLSRAAPADLSGPTRVHEVRPGRPAPAERGCAAAPRPA